MLLAGQWILMEAAAGELCGASVPDTEHVGVAWAATLLARAARATGSGAATLEMDGRDLGVMLLNSELEPSLRARLDWELAAAWPPHAAESA